MNRHQNHLRFNLVLVNKCFMSNFVKFYVGQNVAPESTIKTYFYLIPLFLSKCCSRRTRVVKHKHLLNCRLITFIILTISSADPKDRTTSIDLYFNHFYFAHDFTRRLKRYNFFY